MGDKGTSGELKSEFEGIASRLSTKTLSIGGDAIELAGEQLIDFAELTNDVALALSGNKRVELHVKAQFALKVFSVEARAYLAGVEFRNALAQAILEIVGALVSTAAKLAGEALAGALTGSID